MVFGGPAFDRIQFNEETLWAGRLHDYSNKGAYSSLKDNFVTLKKNYLEKNSYSAAGSHYHNRMQIK
jgi:hypothetical protein